MQHCLTLHIYLSASSYAYLLCHCPGMVGQVLLGVAIIGVVLQVASVPHQVYTGGSQLLHGSLQPEVVPWYRLI